MQYDIELLLIYTITLSLSVYFVILCFLTRGLKRAHENAIGRLVMGVEHVINLLQGSDSVIISAVPLFPFICNDRDTLVDVQCGKILLLR